GPAGHPAYVVVLVAVLVHVAGAAAPVVGERRTVMASVYLARGSGRTQDALGAQPFDLGVAPGDQRPGFDHGERRGMAAVMPARSVAPPLGVAGLRAFAAGSCSEPPRRLGHGGHGNGWYRQSQGPCLHRAAGIIEHLRGTGGGCREPIEGWHLRNVIDDSQSVTVDAAFVYRGLCCPRVDSEWAYVERWQGPPGHL